MRTEINKNGITAKNRGGGGFVVLTIVKSEEGKVIYSLGISEDIRRP